LRAPLSAVVKQPASSEVERVAHEASEYWASDMALVFGAWSDQAPFSLSGIYRAARFAAASLSVRDFCAACDMFGMALAVAPLHAAFETAGKSDAARLVKTFCDRAATMTLSDAEGLRLLDQMLALA